MSQGTRPDWVAIRTEYESGVPRRELRAKYGVTESTLNTHIARGEWKRTRDDVSRKCRGIVEWKIAEAKANEALSTYELAKKNMDFALQMQTELMERQRETGKFTSLDVQRFVETSKTALETKAIEKQETRKNNLVEVLRASVRKGHGEDVPV